MHVISSHETVSGIGLVAVGAAALGLISRIPAGAFAAAQSSLLTPAIVVGVCVVLAPALYIGLSLAGAKTSASTFVSAVLTSWRASGLAALGLAPPLLFMVATTTSENLALALGTLAIAAALAIGLMALAREAAEHSAASFLCFVLWSLAALAVGARFFFTAVSA